MTSQGVIAKETARTLGMGTNIQSSKGLPVLDENGKVPKLEARLIEQILAADGFAEVCVSLQALFCASYLFLVAHTCVVERQCMRQSCE